VEVQLCKRARVQICLTSVHDVVVVKVVHGLKDLLHGMGSVFLCKLAILANPVEKLSASGQLSDNVVLVLHNSPKD